MTLSALGGVNKQRLAENYETTVYLCDDASTDGTSESVRQHYPDTVLINGSGALFWGGGMRKAWELAAIEDYDFYIWLNDDVLITDDCFQTLLTTYSEASQSGMNVSAVVGCCEDSCGRLSYGGVNLHGSWYNPRMKMVGPEKNSLIEVDTMTGNIVLISRQTYQEHGMICERYAHLIGDTDYGLRITAGGGNVIICDDYLGACETNDLLAWKDATVPLMKRLSEIVSKKGLPLRPWSYFCFSHFGVIGGFVLMAKPYIGCIFPKIWKRENQ